MQLVSFGIISINDAMGDQLQERKDKECHHICQTQQPILRLQAVLIHFLIEENCYFLHAILSGVCIVTSDDFVGLKNFLN